MNETKAVNRAPAQNRISLLSQMPSTPDTERRRRYNLSRALDNILDRVAVLGNDDDYGHTGQV